MVKTPSELTRRRLLPTAAAALATGGAAARPASLKDAAARAGLLFGSESDVAFGKASRAYGQLFIDNCALLAPQVSWSETAPKGPRPDPVADDPNIAFAAAHGMRLTGGHMLWHQTTPSWFDTLVSAKDAWAAVRFHIQSVARRYGPLTWSWNVVNEAIEPKDGRADGLKDCQLLRILGAGYVARAFGIAREAAPEALLVYNDWGFELTGQDESARRAALLRLLDRLMAAKAPIDAVGLQSHLRLGHGARFDQTAYATFVRDVASRGVRLLISELDVLDLELFSSIAQRDADVAALYRDFLDVALAEPKVAAVVTWGLADRYSWYNLWRADRRFVRWDNRPTRPLLFDNRLRPKPAYQAVLDALARAPARPHN